jgi:hypothetical protein
MSPLFSREHTIKIWESSFEPYLDPSQWPEYDGPEYVPLRLKGDMDECQGRLADEYDFSDFEIDGDKAEYLCSKCHKEVKECKCRRKKSKGMKSKSTKSTGTRRSKGASNSRVVVEVVCL